MGVLRDEAFEALVIIWERLVGAICFEAVLLFEVFILLLENSPN